MSWKLKKNIFGLNFDLDIETRLPIHEIYSLMLNSKWGRRRYNDRKDSRAFMNFALRYLPKQSYIIFLFDRNEENFLQFANSDGNRVLDVPFCRGNVFYGKADKLSRLLLSEKINRSDWIEDFGAEPNTFFTLPFGKGEESIEVDFGNDCEKAADLALLVAEKVCYLKNPVLVGYESGRLTYQE